MEALIMAGGMGKRLSKDEKPLTLLYEKPLINYVIDALYGAKKIGKVYIATTSRVKKTIAWIQEFKKDYIKNIQTPGNGFVNDMIFAVEKANIKGSVFVIMADLPLVTSELIDYIITKYYSVKTPALSVHMRLEIFKKMGLRPGTVFCKNGDFIVPCGINILSVDKIREEQKEYHLILENELLALNVNTIEDLKICEKYIDRKHKRKI